jgi:signal transduction histidine kinase
VRKRLFRVSLLAAVAAMLITGVAVVLFGTWQLGRQADEQLRYQASIALALALATDPDPGAPSGSPTAGDHRPSLRGLLPSVRAGGRYPEATYLEVRTPTRVVRDGPRPSGSVRTEVATAVGMKVVARVPQSAVTADVVQLLLTVLGVAGLSAVAAVLTASRQSGQFTRPLAVLADNADRVGRGESRLQPIHSGIEELDRVADGLSRSAQSIAATLAAERDFASDASHQLRTPLTALSMRLEEISTSRDIGEVQEEARVALYQVERLTQVVDGLLARSRRTHRETMIPLDLNLLLRQQVEEWGPAFRERSRELRLAPLEPLRVRATPSALSQVAATLIENSLKHGGGAATIAGRRIGGSVVVEFTDDGPGVPPELGSRVFERSVSSSGSTGLGLALARDLAEADGGRLELVRATPPVFALFLNAPDGVSPGLAG